MTNKDTLRDAIVISIHSGIVMTTSHTFSVQNDYLVSFNEMIK